MVTAQAYPTTKVNELKEGIYLPPLDIYRIGSEELDDVSDQTKRKKNLPIWQEISRLNGEMYSSSSNVRMNLVSNKPSTDSKHANFDLEDLLSEPTSLESLSLELNSETEIQIFAVPESFEAKV